MAKKPAPPKPKSLIFTGILYFLLLPLCLRNLAEVNINHPSPFTMPLWMTLHLTSVWILIYIAFNHIDEVTKRNPNNNRTALIAYAVFTIVFCTSIINEASG